jgi:uncharacterized protein DUF4349
MIRSRLPLLFMLCLVAACDRAGLSASYAPAAASPGLEAGRGTLAIEHDVAVEVPDDDIEAAHQAVLQACKGDTEGQCTVLESSISHDEYGMGSLRVRIRPAGVEPLITLAATFGEIKQRTTKAEDLAQPILDTDKRLAMLEAYLADLIKLRQQSRQEVDALIRVAAEIAKTQSELDAARAEEAQLRQRVDLQILAINFFSERHQSFWAPIGEAFTDFRMNLGSGIAQAIAGIVFLLPWLIILIPLLFLLRRLWRKYR